MKRDQVLREQLHDLADVWDSLDGPVSEKRLCQALADELRSVLARTEGDA